MKMRMEQLKVLKNRGKVLSDIRKRRDLNTSTNSNRLLENIVEWVAFLTTYKYINLLDLQCALLKWQVESTNFLVYGELLLYFCHSWQINQMSHIFDIFVTNNKKSSCEESKSNLHFNRKMYARFLSTKQRARSKLWTSKNSLSSLNLPNFSRSSDSSVLSKLILRHRCLHP